MQKPKSLEQIANELAAKREPIKMEPKPKNTGGIDLSRAAGAINQQPKQQPKQNLAQKSRIPSQNLAQNSKIPSQNLAQQPRIPSQKPWLNSEQNSRNSKIPSQPQTASQPQSTQNSKIPSQNFTQKTRIQNLAQKPQPNSEQNARNSKIPSQNLAQKPEPKIEPKPEPKPEKIVIKPKITTFRDDISALYETPAQNLSKTSLFIAFGIAFLVMIATLPKIFIANEIYYTSRDIGTLRDKLGVLNEENRELKSKLEQIRYQNQIIDNLR